MAKMKLDYRGGNVKTNLRELPVKFDAYMNGFTDFGSAIATAYMKTNAPWTDRTAAARVGLHAVPSNMPASKLWEITCAHAVKYGIWLEIANSGRYRILIPTVLNVGHQLMRNLEGSLGRLG